MPPLSGNGQRRRPGNGMNRWNNDQRLTLHLLHSRFELSIGERTRIFNTIFADHLRRCGVTEGLKQTGITAQYAERSKPTGAVAWRAICAEPSTTAEAAKRDLIAEQIARVARTLSINVRRISATGHTMPQHLQHKASGKRGRPRSTTRVEEDLRNINLANSHEDEVPPPTPKRLKRAASQISQWQFEPSHSMRATQEPDVDGDFVPTRPPNTAQRTRKEPQVVVPVTPKRRGRPSSSTGLPTAMPTPPRTPSSRTGPGRRKPDAIIPYHYPSGNTIYLTDDEYKETQQDLVPVAETVAHPPIAGLLFRYWNDDCQSKLNSGGEFIAGRYATTLVPPPPVPSMQDFPWADAAVHLNRDKIATPFVSASNNLAWIVRLAMKEKNRGVKNSRITLIDPNQMNRRTIFHAQPFHRALCRKRPFENAAFMYHGMHEFMIYHKVPREAIMHTFKVDEFFQLVASSPSVSAVLRLEKLAVSKSYSTKILPALKADNIALSRKTVTTLAHVVSLLGLTTDSPSEQIMHVVSDFVKSWGLTVSHQTPEAWSQFAGTFADGLSNRSQRPSSMKNHQGMKLAFLDGVRWSRGDFNTRHTQEKMRLMLVRAHRVGLENPAKILTDELDAAKLSLMLYDNKQQRLLQGNAAHALLSGPEDDDDPLPVTPRSADIDMDDEITYDSEDD